MYKIFPILTLKNKKTSLEKEGKQHITHDFLSKKKNNILRMHDLSRGLYFNYKEDLSTYYSTINQKSL
jgi:hypothetical protein